MDKIIEFKDVTFTYESVDEEILPAVKNLNFSVEKGEFVAILGHNGSGKSTIAKLANAILTPEKGQVLVNGISTADENNLSDIRRNIGMVFQNPDNQIVATIVEDDVAFGPENLGMEPKEIRELVDESLKSVGMYEFRTREPHKLSGGQKQRVAIAGIIAMRPGCIVMDEPTAMLDPMGRAEVLDTVKMLNREKNITFLYVTHFMDEAVEADRVIVMDNGSIIYDGTPREVFRHTDKLKKIGLDVPVSAELAYNLRQNGVDMPNDILTKEEFISAIEKFEK